MFLSRVATIRDRDFRTYHSNRGLSRADIAAASWQKSSISAFNGSCFEVARFDAGRVGVRDTKDQGSGPVLVFNQQEWAAFLGGVKAGEFDLL